jgi:hypothetical protein
MRITHQELIMPIQKPALTSDQKLLLNFLISLLASAATSGMLGMYQYYSANSNINIGTMIIVGMSTFGVSFGHGLYSYVPSHITQEIQALRDTVNDFTPSTPIEQAVTALSVPTTHSSASSNALIHITANTVHIPTAAPAMSPVVPDSQITSANIDQVATQAIQDVVPVTAQVEGSLVSDTPGAIVPDIVPTVTGITTQEEAGQKTQKIAVVKPTVQLR